MGVSEQDSSLRSTTNEPRAREGSLTVPQNDSVLPWGSTSLGNEARSGIGSHQGPMRPVKTNCFKIIKMKTSYQLYKSKTMKTTFPCVSHSYKIKEVLNNSVLCIAQHAVLNIL